MKVRMKKGTVVPKMGTFVHPEDVLARLPRRRGHGVARRARIDPPSDQVCNAMDWCERADGEILVRGRARSERRAPIVARSAFRRRVGSAADDGRSPGSGGWRRVGRTAARRAWPLFRIRYWLY